MKCPTEYTICLSYTDDLKYNEVNPLPEDKGNDNYKLLLFSIRSVK